MAFLSFQFLPHRAFIWLCGRLLDKRLRPRLRPPLAPYSTRFLTGRNSVNLSTLPANTKLACQSSYCIIIQLILLPRNIHKGLNLSTLELIYLVTVTFGTMM